MQIDKNLNLVVPVDADGGRVYIHSMPIGREVFERYFLVISKTFSALYAEGLATIAGPRVAALLLKKVAQDMGAWDGEDGVSAGLMAEVRRLSNVAIPTAEGWRTVPLYDAVRQGRLSEDDARDAEGAIIFFICISAMHKRSQVAHWLDGMCQLWETLTTSLNATEYAVSLSTSTAGETLAPAAPLSSLPG